MKANSYVHGYSGREAERLNDQADTLDNIIHDDTTFKKDSLVLEAGCGVGAQTRIIAKKNPGSNFICVDISEESLSKASELAKENFITNATFQKADIFHLPFKEETFDSVVVCFVLEHLKDPVAALNELKRVLKKEGTIIIIEGDHGSTFFFPESEEAHLAIDCQVRIQKANGGNANIGRELFPLLKEANFADIFVSPRMIYVDANKPNLVEGFIKNTFTSMIEGVREKAIENSFIDDVTFDKGIVDLYRTTEPNGVFCYTFFKAFAKKY